MTELEVRAKRAEKRDDFSSGVLILSLSAVIVKIIGLIYKIPMLALLGSEGMGYFNSAYEIYVLFGVVGTAGLPVAMSAMISRSRERGDISEKKIFSVSMTLFVLLGIVGSVLMLSLAPLSSRIFGSRDVIFCIIAISPTVFFICLCSVYRGFFQGLGRMRETAISQVIEASLKLFLGLVFAYIAIRCGYGVPEVAAFAVLGLVGGSVCSALYLALSKRAHEKGERGNRVETVIPKALTAAARRGRRKILSELLMTAIPISMSSLVMSLTKIIDMTVILRRMQDIGYTSAEAFSAYGGYTTLALPLFSLAPALISSVALPLVPTLSARVARGDSDGQVKVVSDAIKITMIVSMPISLGLCFFSREILWLIFGKGQEAVALGAPLLSLLAISIPLACLITVEGAVLQAYSRAELPMVAMIVGSVAKIILAYILVGNRDVNIAGAPISTFACDLLINAINLAFISKRLPRAIPFGVISKPALAAFISVGVTRLALAALSANLCESNLTTLLFIAICALIYLPILFFVGAIARDDLERIPVINRIFHSKFANNTH